MYYINNKESGAVETIDRFETKREAKEALREYKMNWWGANYYISTRSTKEWRKDS